MGNDEIVKKFGDVGAFGPTIPQEYGGGGLDYISYGILMQEIERGDSGMRSTASVQGSLVMYPIYKFGNEQIENLYWKSGATDFATGKKTLTLIQFENRYMQDFLEVAIKYKGRTLQQVYLQHFQSSPLKDSWVLLT